MSGSSGDLDPIGVIGPPVRQRIIQQRPPIGRAVWLELLPPKAGHAHCEKHQADKN